VKLRPPTKLKVTRLSAKQVLGQTTRSTGVHCSLKLHNNSYPLKIVVSGDPSYLQRIPGLYTNMFSNTSSNSGTMPLCPESIEIIQDVFPEVTFTEELKSWLKRDGNSRSFIKSKTHTFFTAYPGLFEHQNVGVDFILSTTNWVQNRWNIRCLVSDDPRLGKTIQAITVLKSVDEVDCYAPAFPCLILCLKSLILYWQEQLEEWGPDNLEIVILKGPVKRRIEVLAERSRHNNRTVFISNVEFAREAFTKHKIKSQFKKLNTLIIDECHVIKNYKSKIFQSVRKIKTDHLLLLSATPTERGSQDYFGYLNLMRPLQFRSFWEFAETFCVMTKKHFGTEIGGPKNSKLLRSLLEPMVLRREAKGNVSIPDKIHEIIPLETTAKFDEIYQKIKKEIVVQIKADEELHLPNTLSTMTRLRQFSAHPPVLGFDDITSPKIEAIVELCAERYRGQQIVLYCTFKDVIEFIYEALQKAGVGCDVYEGENETIKQFHKGEFQVLLTTPFMGVGINLACASIICYYDLPWSSTVLRQSIERTTEMDKKETQLIISLVASDIDRVVANTLEEKKQAIRDSDIIYSIEKSFKM